MASDADPPDQASAAARPPAPIPDNQWALPVSFSDDGEPVSLRDYVGGTTHAVPIARLTPEQRAALTVLRLEHRPTFQLAMMGVGLVDQKRALAEVRARSPVGDVLIDIEFRTIRQLTEHVPQDKRKG
jgi:hypothetical protein